MNTIAFQDSLSVHQQIFDEIQKIDIFSARDFTTKIKHVLENEKQMAIPMPWLHLFLGNKHQCDYRDAATDLNIWLKLKIIK